MSAAHRQREAGFTLVELAVVLAVLGSALMMVTGILVTLMVRFTIMDVTI